MEIWSTPCPTGRTQLADVAAERGTDAVDVLLDVVLADGLPLTIVFPSLVPSLGRDRRGLGGPGRGLAATQRVVLGGSDAGAHVDLMCHANYPTVVLGELVRDRGVVLARGGGPP